MLVRHQNELLSRLDRVADLGSAEIRRSELLRWYSQERVTVGVWRDIDSRWDEHCREYEEVSSLLVGEEEGVYTLIWGAGLTPSKDAFFRDIAELARRKSVGANETEGG